MNAESPAQNEHYLRAFRRHFRDWRGARPFWAGLFVLFGGFPIMYFPYAHIKIGALTVAMATTAGAGSLIIGVLLVVLGLTLWFQQHVRVFAGVAAILLALVSIPVSNFGGFVVGFLSALIGGALAVAWAPGVPPEPQAAQDAGPGEGGAPEAVDGVGEANHLSGTSPANGANGRHSAG